MQALKDSIKKSLIQQVELMNQTKTPTESKMCCENIYALVAVLDAILQDSQE